MLNITQLIYAEILKHIWAILLLDWLLSRWVLLVSLSRRPRTHFNSTHVGSCIVTNVVDLQPHRSDKTYRTFSATFSTPLGSFCTMSFLFFKNRGKKTHMKYTVHLATYFSTLFCYHCIYLHLWSFAKFIEGFHSKILILNVNVVFQKTFRRNIIELGFCWVFSSLWGSNKLNGRFKAEWADRDVRSDHVLDVDWM